MEQKPRIFTTQLVLDQLRCSGLMGAVAMMQMAYPTRVRYEAVLATCEKMMGKQARPRPPPTAPARHHVISPPR